MSFFIRRSRTSFTVDQLTEIEQIAVIDRTPRTPTTGVGYGTMLLVGEFEDGAFNTPTEVYGEADEANQFGEFGYTYGTLLHQNPCARLRLAQTWNGNGFLKGKNLRPPRKIICRVDTSVGDVTLTLAAALRSNAGPFDMEPVDQLSVTTDAGGPANSTALTATVATAAGAGFAPGPTGFTGGERCSIQIDALPATTITFQAADQTAANVVTRINTTFGGTIAAVNAGEIDISSLIRGTDGNVTLADIDAGTLAAIGHAAGASAGGGNVANCDAVTAAEAAALINSGPVGAINGVAVVDALTGEVVVYRTGSAVGTVRVDDVAGTMATDMGFTVATVITANIGDEIDVPAGTRVRNAGGDEWVTMRTITFDEGTVAAPTTPSSQTVEVRDATDDGSGTGALAGTVTTIVDYPSDRFVEVNNAANLTVALTSAQVDAAYVTAFEATENPNTAAREATVSLSAYRSAQVVAAGRTNAINASDQGCFGRVFVTGALTGTTLAAAIADVVNYRRDRVVYAWPNWTMFVPEIAEVGTAGGTGFTADGVIGIGSDGPLAYLMCALNPEENKGQHTGKLTFLSAIEETVAELNEAAYIALKAAGICAPRVDRQGNFVYQSDVTSSLIPGRETIKRRCMADYIQDSLANASIPYAKKLATDSRRAGLESSYDSFLGGLLSENDPDNQRIAAYGIQDVSADNPDLLALGILSYKVEVQMLPSIDAIVIDTQIGEGVVVTIDA